jgi:hypothetical protein
VRKHIKQLLAFIVIAGILCLLPNSATALLTVITFDDLSNRDQVTDQYSALGVVFSAEYFPGFSGEIYPEYWDTRGGIEFGPSYCNAAAYFQADFSVPVDYVSVELEPFEVWGGLSYDFGLGIYDSSDNLIDELTFTQLVEQSGIIVPLELSSSSANVAYARFYGFWGEVSGINAITADNFTYGTAPVPEPGTIVLLGVGLAGIAGIGKRRFRKNS